MLCFCVFSLYVCALVCVPDGLGGQMSTLDHLDLELYICGLYVYMWVLGSKPRNKHS